MWPYSNPDNNSLRNSGFSPGGPMQLSPLDAELNSGERLLWSGQPRGGLRLQPADIFLIPFSLMWGGFAFFWEALALLAFFSTPNTGTAGGPGLIRYIFPLWGIPFVLIGIYLMVGRFFVDARARSKTWYGITDQRILIVTDFYGRKVQSLFLQDLPELELAPRTDGSGTISFGPNFGYGAGIRPNRSRSYTPPAFEMIEDVRRVYGILQDARGRAASRGSS